MEEIIPVFNGWLQVATSLVLTVTDKLTHNLPCLHGKITGLKLAEA
jgi:hypothetical protein